MWFSKRKTHLEPEVIQLTDDLVALLWVNADEADESRRLRWSIGRVNRNGGKPFRTLHAAHCLQIGEFAKRLAKGLAESPDLPNDLRVKLGAMAQPPREAGDLTHLFSPAALEALRARRDDGSEPGNGNPLRF